MTPHPLIARRRVLALAGIALAGTAVGAPTDEDFNTALERFRLAAGGDTSAVDDAAARFSQLSDAAPQDPVLRAYAGATTALRATTRWLPWRKLAFAEDGLALIDQALAQLTPAHDAPAHRGVPASLETRFVAANTFLGLPAMFKRQERGARLLAELVGDPRLEQAPLGFRVTVWLRAARQAPHSEQGRALLQRVAASGTPQATVAQALLKEPQ
ncbi:MAG TPA: hypothetical protein VFL86_11315 [Burkholderiaceae bacterium]|nr:hypothetical protein [Burkholderiaceae bacterium]